MHLLVAAAMAAAPASPSAAGVLAIRAEVAAACTIRHAGEVVVVCAGRQPYLVRRPVRPARPGSRPEPVVVTF